MLRGVFNLGQAKVLSQTQGTRSFVLHLFSMKGENHGKAQAGKENHAPRRQSQHWDLPSVQAAQTLKQSKYLKKFGYLADAPVAGGRRSGITRDHRFSPGRKIGQV